MLELFDAASAPPHSTQNALSAMFFVPHTAQATSSASEEPQPRQNFALSGLSRPQAGHCIAITPQLAPKTPS